MKAVLECILFIGIVACSGCASLRETHSGSSAEAAVERRVWEIFEAAEQKDFARLDSFHLYGSQFTKFTGTSAERLDSEAARAGEHRGLGAITGLKMRADDLKVDVFGEVAVATFIMDYRFDAGGKAMQSKERTTLVFVNRNGDWKITHEHLSAVK